MARLNRRRFLQASSAVAAGSFVISGTKASGKVIGANDRLRIAVAGLNGRGKSHMDGWLGQENVEISHVIDPDSNVLGGAIKRVDVSKDGGKTWETARLAKPGEKMAMTRFYLDTDWDGEEMMLQSRAMDDTGYVQPTKAQLREVRGLNSIYHNNCIQTWLVRSTGEAENVEVS